VCKPCEFGTYAPQALKDECFPCPAGSSTNNVSTKASTCTPCSSGSYSSAKSTNCIECVAGSYSDTGRPSCTLCPKGSFSPLAGSSSCLLCASEYGAGYSSSEGATECPFCGPNYVWAPTSKDDENNCKLCGGTSGTFMGASCPREQTTVQTLTVKDGYWRTSYNSTVIAPCPTPEFCVGGNNSVSSICEVGHGGPFCMVCQEDYYPGVVGNCIACAKGTLGKYLVIGALLGSIALFAGLVLYFKPYKMISDAGWRRIRNLGKILFVFVQIMTSVPSVFDVLFPSPFKEVMDYLALPALDIDVAFFLGCIQVTTYYSQTLAATLFPISLIVIIFMAYVIRLVIFTLSPTQSARLRVKCIEAALLVVYIFLPVASRIIFGCFACESLDDGRRVLVKDYSLSCETQTYKFMVVFSGVMIAVWPVGPFFFCALLPTSRDYLFGVVNNLSLASCYRCSTSIRVFPVQQSGRTTRRSIY